MSLISVSQGAPVLGSASPPARLLGRSLSSAGASANTYSGSVPAAISGISGWWDVGAFGSAVDANGNTVSTYNAPVASLGSKAGAGSTPALVPYHIATDTSPNATVLAARVNGFLGGAGSPVATVAQYGPTLDTDWGLAHKSLETGSGAAWTLYLVWTRPNWRQGTIQLNDAPASLLHATASGTTIVALGGPGGGLVLFPGTASQVTLLAALERRHTHALILRNTPGAGLDVWLDGTQVAHAVSNPMPAANSGQVLFFHDGTIQGSAQCWFHEAAVWSRALDPADIATLIQCQARWSLGVRRGVNLLVMGQSNAAWFVQAGGARALAQGVAWYLGAAAWGATSQLAGNFTNPARYSIVAGHPISNSSPPLFPPGSGNGTYLTNPGDGSSPSGWSLGPDGVALQAYLTGAAALVSAADESDFAFLLWPWSEQDSTMPYSSKSLYKGTVERLAALTRQMLGRSAPQLPLLIWSAIPYETDAGVQMVRESVADLSGVAAQNIVTFVAQTADSDPLNSTWDPGTGLFSGGDPQHRDEPDLLRYGRIGSHAAARAAMAAGMSDTIRASDVPATGLPKAGGPSIVHAYQQAPTTIVLTIRHDAGNDLIVPLQAVHGAGFVVMDGGSVANPGPLIPATAAVRTDATHITITLAQAPSNPPGSCLLYYPYGSRQIGRGDAVTDNLAMLAPPAGWDMGAELGSGFAINMPLQATAYGIPLSATAS